MKGRELLNKRPDKHEKRNVGKKRTDLSPPSCPLASDPHPYLLRCGLMDSKKLEQKLLLLEQDDPLLSTSFMAVHHDGRRLALLLVLLCLQFMLQIFDLQLHIGVEWNKDRIERIVRKESRYISQNKTHEKAESSWWK